MNVDDRLPISNTTTSHRSTTRTIWNKISDVWGACWQKGDCLLFVQKGEGLQKIEDRSSSSTQPSVTAQPSEEELFSLLLSGILCITLQIFSNGASKPLDLIKKLVSLVREYVFYRYNSKFSKVFRRDKLFLNLVIHFNLTLVGEKSKHCRIWFCTLCLFDFFITIKYIISIINKPRAHTVWVYVTIVDYRCFCFVFVYHKPGTGLQLAPEHECDWLADLVVKVNGKRLTA